ncbi:MAG: hypothetical protein VX929_13000 [Pseudomonadota bacterium]|nr:hypothetical protein [Pseudomonadota bacterium]
MFADKVYDSIAAREILGLHKFLEDWLTGRCANEDEVRSARPLSRFTDDFHITLPAGTLDW